jgi:ABC-type spermidine/putrescine transport system permease subunit I
MFNTLIIIFISLFAVFLVINLFFRIKLLKLYRKLVDRKVDFPPSYILNEEKLKNEIIPKYPDSEDLILAFHRLLKKSLGIAFLVFVLSLLIGYQYILNR